MQLDHGEQHPSAPPARPSLATRAMPSELAARPRPRAIDVSYWLWLAACLVGVITAAATLHYFDELQAAVLSIIERNSPGETPRTRENVATAMLAILIGAGVLLVLVQMAFAMAMHSGRGWARFALVLPALLGALYSIAVFSSSPMMTQAGLLATIVLMIVATVPMFLPGTRAWFAQQRLARSGGYGYSSE
ncbi:MAG: hypothetical protein ACRDTA_09775 [Pseudonocardiaceae bacterium]